jgi:hypothetical protein
MKYKLVALAVLAIGCIALVSCGSKEKKEQKEAASADSDEWPELDAFHAVMAEVYHPLKDSGNVQVIMARGEELAAGADKLASTKLPAKIDNDETKALVKSLQEGTRRLANEIKDGAPEDQVGTELEDLHTLFHQVQEAWYGGHK